MRRVSRGGTENAEEEAVNHFFAQEIDQKFISMKQKPTQNSAPPREPIRIMSLTESIVEDATRRVKSRKQFTILPWANLDS